MRLVSFGVESYESYGPAQRLLVNPDLTVIAGRNNVGKSALLRAMRLIPGGATGAAATEATVIKYVWALNRETLFRELLPDTPRQPWGDWLDAALSSPDEVIMEVDYQYQRAFLTEDLPQFSFNSRFDPGDFNDFTYRGIRFPSHRLALGWARSPQGVFFTWLPTENAVPSDNRSDQAVQVLAGRLPQLLSRFAYIQPRRTAETRPMIQVAPEVASDGSNITNVVSTLAHNSPHTLFAQLQDFVCEAFPEVIRIETPLISTGQPHPSTDVLLVQKGRGTAGVPLSACGTGIEQIVVLAAGVLTAPTPRIYLLDEPHAYLHPSAERALLRFLRAHPEHQYVVATHSGVFLNSVPLRDTRLITMADAGSQINDVTKPADVLSEIGVTAADLWSADGILWVEGASEIAICEVLRGGDALQGLRVEAMPDTSRFSSQNERTAHATYKFLETVVEAVAPLGVRMVFLFDADERSDDHREKLVRASGARALFLPVREVENLLLSPEAIANALIERCTELEVTPPQPQEVRTRLEVLLHDTANTELFKRVPRQGERPEDVVKGSTVLRPLYRELAASDYEKVEDGRRLARHVLAVDPVRLAPLRNALAGVEQRRFT
jgi:hypothetical protein